MNSPNNNTIYVWNIIDMFGNIVAFGTTTEFIEFSLDHLPFGWDGERSLDKVQNTMGNIKEWKDNGYIFDYKKYLIDKGLNILTY